MVLFAKDGKSGQSGVAGRSGARGRNGGNGGDGTQGSNGGTGSDGGDLQVQLGVNSGSQLTVNGKSTGFQLGTAQCLVQLSAQGGDGGKGGEGGSGGEGGQGLNGRDATQSQPGTNGGPGGDGGDGADGGDGGDGGNGGQVIVSVSEKDTDLLLLISDINIQGGRPGQPGMGGYAGRRGLGGQGGRHSNSAKGGHGQNPGQSGSQGNPGQSGHGGQVGNEGGMGSYHYHIIETNVNYEKIFNLVVGQMKTIQSPDLIIEPGESLSTELCLMNETAMNTPKDSPMTVSLVEDPLIIQDALANTVVYNQSIAGQQSVILPKTFQFRIAPQLDSKINSPLGDIYKLKFKAKLNRVNADFKSVNAYEQPVKIEYPVELSFVSGPRSYQEGEEVPFAIGIKNKSSKPLGIKNGRLLNLRVYNQGKAGGVILTPYSSESEKQYEQNNQDPNAKRALDQANFVKRNIDIIQYELLKQVFIPSINAGETIYFKGSLKITDPTIQPYDCAILRFCLDLGHIDEPATKYQCIQENVYKIQKSENLKFRDESDVVVVINQEVQRESIHIVRTFLRTLGTDCDIYNLTQLNRFDYHFDPQNKKAAPHEKKTVVLFGNNYVDNEHKTTNAITEIGVENIFKSAYVDQTTTYIMGSSKTCNYGRIFNYPALQLYQNSVGDEEGKETFPYSKHIKVLMPDLALTSAEFIEQYSAYLDALEDQGAGVSINVNNNTEKKKAELPELIARYVGIEKGCNLLYSGAPSRQMKNLTEISKYYKQNPTSFECVQNLDNGFRLNTVRTGLDRKYDKRGIIASQVSEVHDTLSKLDPLYQYHTRHFYENEEEIEYTMLSKYIGDKYQSSGEQYVIRGLRKDCTQIAFREKGDVAPTIDDGDVYNILKVIPIEKRVGYINKFTSQNDALADLLFDSIGSDLCDEFKAFTGVSFRSGWSAPQYLAEMKGWKAINDFKFDTLVAKKNVSLLKKFLVMIDSVIKAISGIVSGFISTCCCSCIPIPSSVVLSVCKDVKKTITPKILECAGADDDLSVLVSKKFYKASNSNLKFDAISRPDRLFTKGSSYYSNQSSCIVNAFDPLPAWVRQELQYIDEQQRNGQVQKKIEISHSNRVYQNSQQRKNDIDKYVEELSKQQS